MTLSRVVIIDCGASRTALGVFDRRGHGLRLDALAVETFPATAGNEDDWLENTRAALLALGKRVKTAGPVVLVLPAHLVLTKLINTPRVEPAKRGKIIRFEAGQTIPYALTDVVWDSVVVGERETDLEVLLAAAKLEAVEPLCEAAQAAGFAPLLVLPSPLATLAGFRLVHAAQPQPALVLSLGARSTTLVLVESNRFVARTLSLGGHGFPPQIAANQDRDPGEAEAGKLSGRGPDLAADATGILATRLAQEITRSTLHFRRQGDRVSHARVYLTGGGARRAGLDGALAARLKTPVERLDVLGTVETAAGAVKEDATAHALTLTDLIGAAATQLRSGQPVLDLLPPRRRSRENLRRCQPWLIAAAALAVAALVPPAVHWHRVAVAARRKAAAIERELVPLRERAARNRTSLQQIEEFNREAAQLQGAYDRRASWLNLLADLQERLVRVEDAWLEKLQVMPAAAGSPVELVISGRMLDRANPPAQATPGTFNRVKALLASIVDSPFVASVEGERFDNSQPGILKFDFVLVADPQHPL